MLIKKKHCHEVPAIILNIGIKKTFRGGRHGLAR